MTGIVRRIISKAIACFNVSISYLIGQFSVWESKCILGEKKKSSVF